MAKTTKIEYCDSTTNPVMGCIGCELYSPDPDKNHCYSADMCRRYAGRKGWPAEFTEPEHFPGRLEKALKWPDLFLQDRPDKPWLNWLSRVIFVNDMSDGFCPGGISPKVWLEPHLHDMAKSPHIWLLLTKWPIHMALFFGEIGWVPRNFWLGTSVLHEGDSWRIGGLISLTPLTHRLWVSYEPALGPLPELRTWSCGTCNGSGVIFHVGRDVRQKDVCPTCNGTPHPIRWIAGGGESGRNARPSNPDWFWDAISQCATFQIPYFRKQNGEWMHRRIVEEQFPEWAKVHYDQLGNDSEYVRIGKAKAGRVFERGLQFDRVPWELPPMASVAIGEEREAVVMNLETERAGWTRTKHLCSQCGRRVYRNAETGQQDCFQCGTFEEVENGIKE